MLSSSVDCCVEGIASLDNSQYQQFDGVITTRTVQSKRSRRRLLLLVKAVKGNRFKYLYLEQEQDTLTVLLEEIRHWAEATPFVFLMFLH